MTHAERASRWARRFVLAGAAWLVVWQVAELAGTTRRAAVTLGLLGFVLHTVFGKAYALVPPYFDRDLATTRLMPVHLACSLGGTLLLGAAASGVGRALLPSATADLLALAGAVLWTAGVALFLGTLGWTVRGNLLGGETGTGDANAERRPVDRAANLAIPVALAYLAVGSYALLAGHTPLPTLLDGYPPRASHLLGAGFATLTLFAVGFRLLPRFLVAHPPRALVAVVLPAGALGPALLAVGLPAGPVFRLGATAEAVAVVGFAVAFAVTLVRSDRHRVGLDAVLGSVALGSVAAFLGLTFAVQPPTADLVTAHRRLNLLGFLGLAIIGASYQFYPPSVGSFRGANDRTAVAVVVLVAGGLLVETAGLLGGRSLVTGGRLAATVGAAVHLGLLVALFRDRFG
ncbi:hypothetical protein [Haloglomus litoreum]|uniref:hypothetical protein n=1 Tax=Haloglomus litoreum TaxID=3034026 RepID=UPI0023E83650|nr:hypothetical protein [Haloglomus sp. DT116]